MSDQGGGNDEDVERDVEGGGDVPPDAPARGVVDEETEHPPEPSEPA